VYFEKPFLKLERLLLSTLATWPRSRRLFSESMLSFVGDKLWIRRLIETELGIPPGKIQFCEHHLSHAASCFLVSPFPDAAILTVDGVGEWTTTSIAVGRGSQIELLDEIRFPHSLGLLYSAFTAFLGFEVNEGEYKVMGMAPFGVPQFIDEVRRLIRFHADGSFDLDLSYFSFQHSTQSTYSRKFQQLFGDPRQPGAEFDPTEPAARHYADIAASIQAVIEQAILQLACRARERTGINRLCLAGGVALNSAANGRLLREAGFDDIYIQPAAGDSGGALGAALYGWHMIENRPRGAILDRADLGEALPDAARSLDAAGVAYERMPEQRLTDEVVSRLASGKVVAWVQGRFEWGPRSLGQRSILADPRRREMRDHVNAAIKFRETFRPFAPSVLADRAEEFFDLPDARRLYPARFMLYVVPVHERRRSEIPAVTHVDGTARPQVVHSATSPLYHGLISRFEECTGVPALLNTSFNLRGEPIVASPSDALSTFERSGLDALVIDDCLIDKPR
jgi:carbamoyltransferase